MELTHQEKTEISKETKKYGATLLQINKEYQDLCNYLQHKIKPNLLGSGQYAPPKLTPEETAEETAKRQYELDEYLRKHKVQLNALGQFTPEQEKSFKHQQSFLSFAIKEQRFLSKTIAFQKWFLIGVFFILLGFVLYQSSKIKELNKEIYSAKRYIQFIEKGEDKN